MSIITFPAERIRFRTYCQRALKRSGPCTSFFYELIGHCSSQPPIHPEWMYRVAWEVLMDDCFGDPRP